MRSGVTVSHYIGFFGNSITDHWSFPSSYLTALPPNRTKLLIGVIFTQLSSKLCLPLIGIFLILCERIKLQNGIFRVGCHLSTDLGDEELPFDGAATSVEATSQLTLTVESIVTTTSITTSATGVMNSANPLEIVTTTQSSGTVMTSRGSVTALPTRVTPGHAGISFNYANFYGILSSHPVADRRSFQTSDDFSILDAFRFPEDMRSNTLNLPSVSHSMLTEDTRRISYTQQEQTNFVLCTYLVLPAIPLRNILVVILQIIQS